MGTPRRFDEILTSEEPGGAGLQSVYPPDSFAGRLTEADRDQTPGVQSRGGPTGKGGLDWLRENASGIAGGIKTAADTVNAGVNPVGAALSRYAEGLSMPTASAAQPPPLANGPGPAPQEVLSGPPSQALMRGPLADGGPVPTPMTPPRPVSPQGGGGGGNLARDVKDANGAYMNTFDTQEQHTRDLTDAQMGRHATEMQLGMDEAARQRAEVAKAQALAEENQRNASAYLKKTDDLNTALSKGHIDPSRLWNKSDAGDKVAMVIGGFLGNFIPGVKPMMKMLDLNVEQDIESQKMDYERQAKGIQGRESIYGHMVKAHGDSQLAMMQARAGLMDAAKTQIQAQLAGAAAPETAAKGQLAIDAIDQQQALLRKQIAEQALHIAQQQQAARASAQAHAEQLAWARSKDIAELRLKEQELGVKRLEAEGKAGKQRQEIDKDYTDRILRGKVPEQEGAIASLRGQLVDEKGVVNTHKRIPGLSPFDDFKDKMLPTPGSAADTLLGFGGALNKVAGLTSDERVNRNNWDRAKLSYQVDVTGSGGSDAQMAIIDKAFAGARTPEEQANAIMVKDQVIRDLKLAAAQGDPEVIRRMEAARQMPASAKRVK
jgi:hypothetical protein